ncbi:class I SAM-dependent methyltransferase [Lichenicola sp.]|uniref:class I SAM-dependent methyltransferase n=1 Tax=Lichenicola sp. TaxID=2804529 RepID=UPI003B004287
MKLQKIPRHSADVGGRLSAGAATAYDAAGADYLSYADGDPTRPFEFEGCLGFADREIWRRIDARLAQLAAAGQRHIRILDAGCGPGTWLGRIVLGAHTHGFTTIEAHGLDISPAMVALARTTLHLACSVHDITGARLDVSLADLNQRLPFPDRHFDIGLCLYGVLNHLPRASHAAVASELARVTGDALFVTVRAVGSLPTIYVDRLDRARSYRQDNDADWLDVDLADGRHLGFPSHLFRADELRGLFRPLLGTVATIGLDVFHGRFATDPNWNPRAIRGQDSFDESLDRLEREYGSDPNFIDRAAHILLVGEQSPGAHS